MNIEQDAEVCLFTDDPGLDYLKNIELPESLDTGSFPPGQLDPLITGLQFSRAYINPAFQARLGSNFDVAVIRGVIQSISNLDSVLGTNAALLPLSAMVKVTLSMAMNQSLCTQASPYAPMRVIRRPDGETVWLCTHQPSHVTDYP